MEKLSRGAIGAGGLGRIEGFVSRTLGAYSCVARTRSHGSKPVDFANLLVRLSNGTAGRRFKSGFGHCTENHCWIDYSRLSTFPLEGMQFSSLPAGWNRTMFSVPALSRAVDKHRQIINRKTPTTGGAVGIE